MKVMKRERKMLREEEVSGAVWSFPQLEVNCTDRSVRLSLGQEEVWWPHVTLGVGGGAVCTLGSACD